jgi:gliding motility-associated-like protein
MIRNNLIFFILIFIAGVHGFSQPVTNAGTDFWIAFQPNGATCTCIVVINSPNVCTGNISSIASSYSQDFTVTPGISTEITLPAWAYTTKGITNKGFHLVTDLPVTIDCFNFSNEYWSTDSYLALPVEALGEEYYVMSYGKGSMVSVVATQDSTHVSIHFKAISKTENVVLNKGQAYLTNEKNTDITGSTVMADHPVAVFGSDVLANIPDTCTAADHLVEEMMPVETWGKDFFTVSLGGSDLDEDYFRILAKNDGTIVKINDSPVATISKGSYYEIYMSGTNTIRTSNPVMVAQFAKSFQCSGSKGDPFMMLIPPRQQYIMEYQMGTIHEFNQNWVNIIASPNAMGAIYLDGILMPSSVFSEIGSSGYFWARDSLNSGAHTFLCTAPFQLFSYGWEPYNSYGHPAGGGRSPLALVANIVLAPDSALGYLNVTNLCFTATVTDISDMPLKGIMLDFKIHGMGDILKNIYTDSLGQARFCYTRTGNVPGMDSIFAEISDLPSTTSRAYWVICTQPVAAGSIGNSQSSCVSFTPDPILNITTPSGYTGELEYRWQKSIVDGSTGFMDIPASDTPSYSPSFISQATWFRRLSRVKCTTDWPAEGISNVVDIIINSQFTPGITVSVSPNPYCEGKLATITAAGSYGGNNPGYQWILNGTPAGTDTSLFSWVPSPGDSIRCIFSSSLTCVTVNPVSSTSIIMNPDLTHPAGISISATPNPFCSGSMVTLTASPVNGGLQPSCQWRINGIVTGADSPSYSYAPSTNDQVDCLLTSDLDCVSGNPVLSPPLTMTGTNVVAKFSVTPVETSITFPLITFTDESSGTTNCRIDWGDGTVTPCDSIHHLYLNTGTFTIKEFVQNAEGCSDSSLAQVTIGEEYNLYIPNAFTPNGDGLNDVFRPTFKGGGTFSMRIFNRNGEEIFYTDDPVNGWDGRYNGELCPEGNYVYKIEFSDGANPGKKIFSGLVYLLKN